jgi:hypothetical protein
MKISKLFQALEICKQINITPCLVGERGVGKTQTVGQYAKSIGARLITIRVGRLDDPGELQGMPLVVQMDGKAITTYAPLEILKVNPEEKTVIFFDEINRCKPSIVNGLFEMLENPWKGNVQVIAAANPPTDNYSVLDFSDAAFSDRMLFLKVEANVNDFATYIRNKNNTIADFIIKNPTFLQTELSPWEIGEFIQTSPRSWERVAEYTKDKKELSDLELEVLQGLVGVEAVSKFYRYMLENSQPTLKDVLSGSAPKITDPSVIDSILNETQTYICGKQFEVLELINVYKFLNQLKETHQDQLIGHFKSFNMSDDAINALSDEYLEFYETIINNTQERYDEYVERINREQSENPERAFPILVKGAPLIETSVESFKLMCEAGELLKKLEDFVERPEFGLAEGAQV